MQKITKKDYEELKNKIQILSEFLNGGKGSGNFNPGQGRGVGKPNSLIGMNAKKQTWYEFQGNLRNKEFLDECKQKGIKSYDDLWKEWAKSKLEDFKDSDIKQLTEKETGDLIFKKLNDLNPNMWFVNADSSYKPKIVTRILENKDLRNAGLNQAYYNYKYIIDSSISFKDFVNKEITFYRGHRGQKKVESDWFDSYTPKEKYAKMFGNKIEKIKMKPRDTLGSYTTNSESEYLILTKLEK